MKNFQKLSRKIRTSIAAAVMATGLISFSFVSMVQAANVSFPGTATDCDANAVMYCGALSAGNVTSKYNSGDGKNSATSIQNIFAHFGIDSADVNSLSTTAVAGYVTKSGDVYAGDKLVATGAVTAGRQNISGSTAVSSNGTNFYKRSPSVSFRSNSIKAYVVMKNGVFDYAILSACGNPVTATPKKPNYNVVKDVRVKGQSAWQNAVSVKSGTTVEYRVTVQSTGEVAATNITVKDMLPANVTYVNGSLSATGATVTSAFFTTGDKIPTLNPGTSVVYTFSAVVGQADKPETCKPEKLVNNGMISSPGLPNDTDDATVNKECNPVPPTTPPVTPPVETPPAEAPPAELPKTGAGEVIGLFAATAFAGTMMHKFVASRRRSY